MTAVQRSLYRIIELVRSGSAAGLAKCLVPIVDAAVVNELTLAIENRHLRRDLNLAKFDQRMLRVL